MHLNDWEAFVSGGRRLAHFYFESPRLRRLLWSKGFAVDQRFDDGNYNVVGYSDGGFKLYGGFFVGFKEKIKAANKFIKDLE